MWDYFMRLKRLSYILLYNTPQSLIMLFGLHSCTNILTLNQYYCNQFLFVFSILTNSIQCTFCLDMRFFYTLCCFSVFIYDCVCFFHPQGVVSPCPCLTVWISPQDIPSTPAAVLNTGGQGSPDILGQRLQGILATPPRITPYSTPLVPTNMEEDQTFPTHNTPLQELTQVGQSKSLLIHFHISEQWISVNWLVDIFLQWVSLLWLVDIFYSDI